MSLATLTTKGQLTIPKDVREALKLHSGDKIEIVVTDNGEAIMRPLSRTVDQVFRRLHRSTRKPVTVEAMNQAIKKSMQARYR